MKFIPEMLVLKQIRPVMSVSLILNGNIRAVPVQAWTGREFSRFQKYRHIKMVKLLALKYRPPLFPRDIPGTHFCQTLSILQDHRATGRVSVKNSYDTIRNRTRDLPACSAMPQPNAQQRVPIVYRSRFQSWKIITLNDFREKFKKIDHIRTKNYPYNWHLVVVSAR